jgi:hypothetical protein
MTSADVISDIGLLIALFGETSDIVMKGLVRLLSIVLEVLGVPRWHVGALKVP